MNWQDAEELNTDEVLEELDESDFIFEDNIPFDLEKRK